MFAQPPIKKCDPDRNTNGDFKIDFIGIGTSKAGTTWVSEMLDAHPGICVSEPKEVNYFNEQDNYYLIENLNYNKGLNWYKNHFLHWKTGQIIGEFTPKYLSDPKAPLRIKMSFPDVKLIVCLRNPVDRAFSQYIFIRYFKKKEGRSFEEVVRKEPQYIEKGLYFKHLNRYFQYFDKTRIHIIWFDDIKSHPTRVLKDLFVFLGVNETFNPLNTGKKINAARQSRFHQLPELTDIVTRALARYKLSFIIKAIKKTGIHTIIKKANIQKLEYTPMQEQTRIYLKQKFADDIAGLEKLLNKDLSHWK
jgi:hypothetical protein